MSVKIFYPTKDGKIIFTKQELEKLLDDVYNEGHKDGCPSVRTPLADRNDRVR